MNSNFILSKGAGSSVSLKTPASIESLTIKVFTINGKRAKTITTGQALAGEELDLKMIDLDKGTYILNAFKNGHFVKSFKVIKD